MELNEIYKCSICGNVVEIVDVGGWELVCCGQAMELYEEKSQDQWLEKHVPIVEIEDDLIVIKVGEIPHPMDDSHFIQWIEIVDETAVNRKYLEAWDEPLVTFKNNYDSFYVRAFCNIHWLWSSE